MNDVDTVRVWKDPENEGRGVAAEHPSGSSEFGEVFGGLFGLLAYLEPAKTKDTDTAACCGG